MARVAASLAAALAAFAIFPTLAVFATLAIALLWALLRLLLLRVRTPIRVGAILLTLVGAIFRRSSVRRLERVGASAIFVGATVHR